MHYFCSLQVQVSPKKISQLSQWAGVQRRHLSLDMGVKVYRDGGEGAFAHEKVRVTEMLFILQYDYLYNGSRARDEILLVG